MHTCVSRFPHILVYLLAVERAACSVGVFPIPGGFQNFR